MEAKYLLSILIIGAILIFSFIGPREQREERTKRSNNKLGDMIFKAKSIFGEEISMSKYIW